MNVHIIQLQNLLKGPLIKQLIWGCIFHPRYIPAPKEGIIEEAQYVAEREEELNRLFDEGEAGE